MTRIFHLTGRDLASALAVQELVADCGPVVQQLIDRYDLKGRNLMSVGAGGAFEEMAMLDRGVRRAFLFDIDEHDSLGRILPPLPQADPATAPVVYVLDDFTKVQPDSKDMDPIDLLYFSGFTPDEVRRGEFRNKQTADYLGARTWATLRGKDPNWPADANPLHDVVLAAIDLYLKDDGYFIVQSYCDGVDALSNPGYVKQWEKSLAEHNVALVEGYCFRAAPGVTLWVGLKLLGGPDDRQSRIAKVRGQLAARPHLTRFHGRAQLEDKELIRFYPEKG